VRRRGSGNYIAPKLEQPLSRLTSFSEELDQRGFKPSSRWLTRGFSIAAPDEQLSLGLTTGERVARLERLRLADKVVMAYEVSVLPESVLADPEAVDASLYAYLSRNAVRRCVRCSTSVPSMPRPSWPICWVCRWVRRCCSSPAWAIWNRVRPSS